MVQQSFLQRPAHLPVNYDHFIERNLSSVAMVLKRRRNVLKIIREASVALFKKKRFEVSSFPIFDQYEIDNSKLGTTNTSNMEDDFQTWFWNNSVNESDLNLEEEDNNRDNWFWNNSVNENDLNSEGEDNNRNNRNDENLGKEHSKTERETNSKVLKQELK